MSTYFVGDIHGCYDNLRFGLDFLKFNPNTDTLCITGDLVGKGPNSLKVLHFLKNIKNNVHVVLGNHDLYLLESYYQLKNNCKKYNHFFNSILSSSNCQELINWLRNQSILYIDENKKILMSHAGINPYWTLETAKKSSQEIETILKSKNWDMLFNTKKQYIINNNKHNEYWKKIILNIKIFTQMRYFSLKNKKLNTKYQSYFEKNPKDLLPWFNIPGFIAPKYSIIFGHWASLKKDIIPIGFYGLDYGCCWGGKLAFLKWENKKLIFINCSSNSKKIHIKKL